MNYFMIILKGILIGFCSIAIPGLSASTVAIILGIYFTMIESISGIFKSFKKSVTFLASLILGYAIGGFSGSVIIDSLYDRYPLVVTLAVLGFVVGSLPSMFKTLKDGFKKLSNVIVYLLVMVLLIVYSYFVTSGNTITFDNMKLIDYILLFIVGLITSATLVVPGVDFAMVLLSFGYYYAIIGVFADIFNFSNFLFNISILGTYLIGYGIGSFLFSKLIKKLNDRYAAQMQFMNLAFVSAAPLIVIKKSIIDNSNFYYSDNQNIVGLILFFVMFMIVYMFYHFTDKNDTRIEANKKRNMFRFFYCIITQPFKVIKYYREIRKAIKSGNLPYNERFEVGLKIIHDVEKRGRIYPKIYGTENIPERSTFIIANHQGRYDAFGVFDAFKDHPFNFITRSDRINMPLYRDFIEMLGSIIVDVDNPRQSLKEIKRCAEELKGGMSYLGFIEGTHTNNKNTLQEFKAGMLNAAFMSGVPITIVVLYDTYKVFGISSLRKIYPEYHILKPIQYEEYKDMTKKELSELIRSKMQEKLDEINERKQSERNINKKYRGV